MNEQDFRIKRKFQSSVLFDTHAYSPFHIKVSYPTDFFAITQDSDFSALYTVPSEVSPASNTVSLITGIDGMFSMTELDCIHSIELVQSAGSSLTAAEFAQIFTYSGGVLTAVNDQGAFSETLSFLVKSVTYYDGTHTELSSGSFTVEYHDCYNSAHRTLT